MKFRYKSLIAAVFAMLLVASAAESKETGVAYKNSGMNKYTRKNYAGAISDFDKYLALNPSNKDIILLRGLSKSLLNPEDVKGACADFLVVKDSLKNMNVESYCANEPGW